MAYILNLEKGVAPNIIKAYRMGPALNPKRRGPRDILVQFTDSRTRQKILKEAMGQGFIPYKDHRIQAFPDVPQEALKIRKSLKETTARLQQENIRYRWLASGGLQVTHRGSTLHAMDEETGKALLEALKITEPMDTSGRSAKRRHESPGSPERNSKVSPPNPSSFREAAQFT
ncbi:UNVERIFIED_CONTAM: hypothetical protein K2H54_038490 [Gekko kuhli]